MPFEHENKMVKKESEGMQSQGNVKKREGQRDWKIEGKEEEEKE